MRKIKVGLIQQSNTADIRMNLMNLAKSIEACAAHGAQLIVLQELHNSLYFCQTENTNLFDLAEPIPGPSTGFYSELAAANRVVLVTSLFEKRAPGLYHNTAVVFDRDGSIAGKYRKMHIPDDPAYYEKFYFTPGDIGFEPIQTSLGKLGVLVCWDQWYPEAARLMALKGAELLIYPTAIGWESSDTDDEKARQLNAWIISLIVSMFTALVISRLLNLAFYAVGCRNEKLYGRAKEHKTIDFMKHRWVCFILSLVVIVAGFVGMIGYGAAGKGSLNFSLEFKGGTSISADFGKDYTVEQVEDKIVPEVAKVINDNAIQASTVSGSNVVTIKTKTLSLSEREEVNQMLVDKFGVDESTIESQSIGSTISNEMRSNAVKALIVACIFMLFYIWFRFKDIRFAGSAIIALVHDVLVMLTGYALIRISVGNTFIACILTIVGYSINDTIVIFDRIRENMQGMKKQTPETLAEVANRSLTQTLSRSLNTSITTIIMVLLLFILGVSSIREFALPLMIGLISGTYSSIFIAAALWYVMKLHLGKDKLMKTAAAKTKKK